MERDDQAKTDLTWKKQEETLAELSEGKTGLPVPSSGGDGLTFKEFSDVRAPAYNNQEFIIALYGLLSEVNGQEGQSKAKLQLMVQAMKRNDVKIEEAIEGFWGAYSDPYVSGGNIAWRFIWKHIQEYRENQPRTYNPPPAYKG